LEHPAYRIRVGEQNEIAREHPKVHDVAELPKTAHQQIQRIATVSGQAAEQTNGGVGGGGPSRADRGDEFSSTKAASRSSEL
jgi:hypothetical protein